MIRSDVSQLKANIIKSDPEPKAPKGAIIFDDSEILIENNKLYNDINKLGPSINYYQCIIILILKLYVAYVIGNHKSSF